MDGMKKEDFNIPWKRKEMIQARLKRFKSIFGTIFFISIITFFIFFLISDNYDGKYYFQPGTIKGKNISFDDNGRNSYHIALEINSETISRYFSASTYYSVNVGDRVTVRMYQSKHFKNVSIRGVYKCLK